MTLFFFLFRSKQRKCHTYPHPLPPTHTPCRKREEINQRAREEKVLKDMSWGSTRDNSALRHRNYAAFLSPASQITVLAPSCLSRTSAPTVPGGGGGWGCSGAIWSTSPFPEVNTHFPYRASPFCQPRKQRSQPGTVKCAWRGHLFGAFLDSGWEPGKLASMPAYF